MIWLKRKRSLIDYLIGNNEELDAIIELIHLQELVPNYEWSYNKMIKLLHLVGDFEAIRKQNDVLKRIQKQNENVKIPR